MDNILEFLESNNAELAKEYKRRHLPTLDHTKSDVKDSFNTDMKGLAPQIEEFHKETTCISELIEKVSYSNMSANDKYFSVFMMGMTTQKIRDISKEIRDNIISKIAGEL